MDYLIKGIQIDINSICPMSGGDCTCYAGGTKCSGKCYSVCYSVSTCKKKTTA